MTPKQIINTIVFLVTAALWLFLVLWFFQSNSLIGVLLGGFLVIVILGFISNLGMDK